jgi:RNA polymerase sigma factor (sigma-70 family)
LSEGEDELLREPGVLARFRAGDRAVLERVYFTCFDDVATLLRAGFVAGGHRIPPLTERAAQLDAIQDVFVRAFGPAARAQFDGLRPYRPYLLTIARNLRIDALRRARVQLVPLEEDAHVKDEAALSPEVQREHQRLCDATAAYVAGLDAEAQRFVELRFAEETSQRDLAEKLGVSRRHVRTLEARILAGLQSFLRKR